MKYSKRIFATILAIVLCLTAFPVTGLTANAAATSGSISGLPIPIKSYPISTANNTRGYNNKSDANYAGTIYATDLSTINNIGSDGWITVNYPTSGGKTRTLKFRVDTFFCGNTYRTAAVTAKSSAYRRSTGGDTIGSVGTGDTLVYVIGNAINGRYQLVYKVDGTNYYKMGWCPTNCVRLSSNNSNMSSSSANWQWPVSNSYVCGNGWSQYYSVKGRDHLGVDIKSSSGDTTVRAAAAGKVYTTGWNSSNGNCVVIEHSLSGKTVYSFYGHLSSISVKSGQSVSVGTKIGVIGNTGSSSTGVHLHFGITTQHSTGTWGYGSCFSDSANSTTWQGYTYYNPFYVVNNDRLP